MTSGMARPPPNEITLSHRGRERNTSSQHLNTRGTWAKPLRPQLLNISTRPLSANVKSCRCAALAGCQLYGWTGTCLGGRPSPGIGNLGSLHSGNIIDELAVRRRELYGGRLRAFCE